jgi:hypothetical protein
MIILEEHIERTFLRPATHYPGDLTGIIPDQIKLTPDEHTHYQVDLTDSRYR